MMVSKWRCPLMFTLRFCSNRRKLSSGPVELAFTRYGDPDKDRLRSPLFICHGLFGQKENWHSVAKALQQRLGCTVYTLDLRNHGQSPWSDVMNYDEMSADVVKLMESISKQFDVPRFHLLGHSMGGRTAMRLAIEPSWQHLIDRLIIEDVSPKTYDKDFGTHMGFRKYIRAMAAMDLRKTRKELLKEFEVVVPDLAVRQFLLKNLVSSELPNQFQWQCNLMGIDKNLEVLLRYTFPAGSFKGPTLFCYGEKSDYVKITDHDHIRSMFPNVSIKGVANAGHWIHAEQPTIFIDIICRFLH
uniref:sn-1-specific diacylglycerol lipase ABHD11 n=1 Tax=Angiostrongylus cantonensis TaxID=6313 RepID=A0A0K0DAC2_ANGCA